MSSTGSRVRSIDNIRGAVMVLMAVDHVRVYSGIQAGGPTLGIFFTRWITHFCAPAFVFLAGTSAFLHGRKLNDTSRLARYLVTRGLLLVVLELTVIKFAWTFNLDYGGFILAGVIWMLGWCMVLLAGLIWLPTSAIGIIGLIVIFAQNIVGLLAHAMPLGSWGWIWQFLYLNDEVKLGAQGPTITVLYTIVPWIGVMAAGYAFGRVLSMEPARRNRTCLMIGLGATGLFLILRGFNLYGDPRPWTAQLSANGSPGMPALLAFLNTTKYPASLNFLLMTLGPTIALIPLLEGAAGTLARWIAVFGRVPFFYYMLHIPLIHALALVVSKARLGEVSPWLFTNHPMGNPPAPEGYTWSLGLLYAVWAAAIVILYFACRWFADLKARRTDWWLRYV